MQMDIELQIPKDSLIDKIYVKMQKMIKKFNFIPTKIIYDEDIKNEATKI